jgi:hypothetical protein
MFVSNGRLAEHEVFLRDSGWHPGSAMPHLSLKGIVPSRCNCRLKPMNVRPRSRGAEVITTAIVRITYCIGSVLIKKQTC